MPRLTGVIEYAFVTPELLARGVDEQGRLIEPIEDDRLVVDHATQSTRPLVDVLAARQEQLVLAFEIEVEVHRDAGVRMTPMWHSHEDFEQCDCRTRLEHARSKTRTAERSVPVKVWILGGPTEN